MCAQGAISIGGEDRTYEQLKAAHPRILTTACGKFRIHATKEPDTPKAFIEAIDCDQVLAPSLALGGLGPGLWVSGPKAVEAMKVSAGRWIPFELTSDECDILADYDNGNKQFKTEFPRDEPRPLREFITWLGENCAVRVKIVGHSCSRRAANVNGVVACPSSLLTEAHDYPKVILT